MPSRVLVRLGQTLALLLIMLTSPAFAQNHPVQPDSPASAASTSDADQQSAPEAATARFFNRDVITFRSDLLGRSPTVRARSAEEVITRIVTRDGDAKVSFRDVPQGTVVLLSGELVSLITPNDLDLLSSQTMAEKRSEIGRRLSDAIHAAVLEQRPTQLLHGVLWSLLASVIAGLLLVGLRMVQVRVHVLLARWASERAVRTFRSMGQQLVTGLRTLGVFLLRLLALFLILLIIEEWVRFVLGQFSYTRPWAEAMTGWIIGMFTRWGTAVAHAIPGLIAAFAILMLAKMLANTISLMFRGVQSGRYHLLGIDSQLAEPTRKLVVAIVWLFAIAMAYPYLPGAQTDAFKGLSVLVGLMVTLGASSIVAQAAASFTILYSRTMTVGEFVCIGDQEGQVMHIGLFTSRVRTMTGVEVSFPNTVVLGGELKNFSRHPDGAGMWLETKVTIGYDTPWRQVQRMLIDSARATNGVQKDPAPYVLQTALSDFYVEYLLRVRVRELMGRLLVLSALHANIQDAFNAEGVQIMSPNYVADSAEPKLVSPDLAEGSTPVNGADEKDMEKGREKSPT